MTPPAPSRLPLALRSLFVLAVAVLFTAASWAQQQRPVALPADATYGELVAFQYPEAKIGKKTVRFSPAAKIYNTQNLIVMPSTVTGKAKVLYRLDGSGQVSHMWLLTAEEAAARAPKTFKTKPVTPVSAVQPAGTAR